MEEKGDRVRGRFTSLRRLSSSAMASSKASLEKEGHTGSKDRRVKNREGEEWIKRDRYRRRNRDVERRKNREGKIQIYSGGGLRDIKVGIQRE
jgi:hypothetical protein